MRALGRIGADELRTAERAFAAGDRVVTTRNDRAVGVVNGQAGVIAGIRSRQIEVRFDDGRWVQIPERYASEGHLDHGYATTAHRAQGATVDRAFVLGSDELYREWGYTALSRHRQEARFYVSATPTFLNEAPAPLQAGDDVPFRLTRMLETSRAKHLASCGVHRGRDPLAAPERGPDPLAAPESERMVAVAMASSSTSVPDGSYEREPRSRLQLELTKEATRSDATTSAAGTAPTPLLITAQEAGELLRIPRSTVYELARNRRIPFVKVGRRILFVRQSLLEWIAAQTVHPRA